jgi:hypothetical protein
MLLSTIIAFGLHFGGHESGEDSGAWWWRYSVSNLWGFDEGMIE